MEVTKAYYANEERLRTLERVTGYVATEVVNRPDLRVPRAYLLMFSLLLLRRWELLACMGEPVSGQGTRERVTIAAEYEYV